MSGAEGNSSFSQLSPNLQLAWDSTSLGLLKECPRKYQLSIVQGYATAAENVHLSFGQFYHSALESYDHARAKGQSHDQALRTALRTALLLTRVETPHGWRPWDLGDSNKNRFTLVRTVVWYLLQFGENDPAQTVTLANGQPAVEVSFRLDTAYQSLQGETFQICGHIDRIAVLDGRHYIFDRKTTKHTIYPEFVDNFRPDNQMDTYDFAGGIVFGYKIHGIVIDGAQIAVGFARFQRGVIERTDSQRAEYYADFGFWTSQAEYFARAGYWPMNTKSCGNYGGCVFRGICAKSPEVREMWLKQTFKRRTWDPLQIRGDV